MHFLPGTFETSGATPVTPTPRCPTRASRCSARPARSSARAAARRPAPTRSTSAATSTSASASTAPARSSTRARSPTSRPSSTSAARARPASSLDATQAPLFLRQVGSTLFFRYWTKGTYTSGALTITFQPGSYGFLSGAGTTTSTAQSTPTDFTVGGIATPNIGYLDVQLAATAGTELDEATITDADPELRLAGAGAGTRRVPGRRGADAPGQLAGLPLLPGGRLRRRRRRGRADRRRVRDARRSSTCRASPTSAPPRPSTSSGSPAASSTRSAARSSALDELNGRGWFDVDFAIPGYATGIDVASVTDLDPEFTAAGHHARRHARADPGRAPTTRSATSSPPPRRPRRR